MKKKLMNEKGILRHTLASLFLATAISTAASSSLLYFRMMPLLPERIADIASSSPLEKKIEKRWRVNVIGKTNESNLERLYEALQNVERNWDNFKKQIPYTKIINLPYKQDGEFVGTAKSQNKSIELWAISEEIIVHELMHIYHLRNPRRHEINDEWGKVAGYSDEERLLLAKEDKNSNTPIYGFTRAYGARNIKEDIATYCQYIFLKLGSLNWGAPLRDIPTGDTRYLQKLDLLKKFEFISEREHELMIPYFVP